MGATAGNGDAAGHDSSSGHRDQEPRSTAWRRVGQLNVSAGDEPEPAQPSAVEVINRAFERIAELERRMDAVERIMYEIGGLQREKR
jgi:hypothetical protein